MKTFRGTFVLAILVVLFGGYAYYDFAKTQKDSDRKAEAEKVVKFKTGDVRSLEMRNSKGLMSWELKDSRWRASQPFTDEAETESMNSYLDSITAEKAQELKPNEGGVIAWKEYSLDEPVGGDLTLKNASGESVRVQVSRDASFDGQYYLRLGDQLFLGSSAWSRVIEKSPGQLRNRKLMRSSGTVEKIELEFSTAKESAVKVDLVLQSDGKWILKGLPGMAIDAAKVEKYLNELKDARALDYLAYNAGPAELQKYGLQRPTFKLRFDFRTGGGREGTWQLVMAEQKDGTVSAKSSDADGILKLSDYEKVHFRKKVEDFRDAKAPFQLALESVSEVTIKDAKKTLLIKKEGSDWKLAKAVANQVLNQEKLTQVFEQLRSWEAKKFLSKGQASVMKAPSRELSFRDSSGKSLLRLEIGEVLKKEPSESESLNLVRSNLDQGLLAVSSKFIDQLPVGELLKADAGTPEEPEPKPLPLGDVKPEAHPESKTTEDVSK